MLEVRVQGNISLDFIYSFVGIGDVLRSNQVGRHNFAISNAYVTVNDKIIYYIY